MPSGLRATVEAGAGTVAAGGGGRGECGGWSGAAVDGGGRGGRRRWRWRLGWTLWASVEAGADAAAVVVLARQNCAAAAHVDDCAACCRSARRRRCRCGMCRAGRRRCCILLPHVQPDQDCHGARRGSRMHWGTAARASSSSSATVFWHVEGWRWWEGHSGT